jgi:uncharacterized small protein (DUF1192 family)
MDWDDVRSQPKPVIAIGEPLATLSVRELEERIAALEQEILRVRTEIASKRAHEQAASAIFKR